MRRLVILTSVCVAFSFGTFQQVISGEPSSSIDAAAVVLEEDEVTQDQEKLLVQQLRQKYVGLVTEQVKSWSKKDLERKIKEAEAVKLLMQAEDILNQVSREYPDTPSARIASNFVNQLGGYLSHYKRPARRAEGTLRLSPRLGPNSP